MIASEPATHDFLEGASGLQSWRWPTKTHDWRRVNVLQFSRFTLLPFVSSHHIVYHFSSHFGVAQRARTLLQWISKKSLLCEGVGNCCKFWTVSVSHGIMVCVCQKWKSCFRLKGESEWNIQVYYCSNLINRFEMVMTNKSGKLVLDDCSRDCSPTPPSFSDTFTFMSDHHYCRHCAFMF